MTEVLEGIFLGEVTLEAAQLSGLVVIPDVEANRCTQFFVLPQLDQRTARYSQTPLLRLSRRPLEQRKDLRPANVATLDTLARSDYLNATSKRMIE